MTAPNTDLERRLGDLYAGPSLEVTVRTDATSLVLAGVRRARRRRRTVQAGASALAATVLGGFLLSDGLVRGASDRAPTPPAAASVTEPGRRTDLVMTAQGVGSLRLGMTRAQAEATGLLVGPSDGSAAGEPRCLRYEGRRGILYVQIGDRGVARISVDPFIPTPEGVAVGHSYRELHAAYPASVPSAPSQETELRVPVPGSHATWYVFSISQTDTRQTVTLASRVAALSLDTGDPACR